MLSIRQIVGQKAEQNARHFLENQGLIHLKSNFKVRGGEIDLIMQDGKELVFVEVRFRQQNQFGGAIASVNFKKQKRLILAAQHYLARLKVEPLCRFDCVFFQGDQNHPMWIKNAFLAE